MSIWDLTDEDRKSMNSAGFSQKALDLFNDREFLKKLDDPSVCHTAESKAGEKLRYCIKVQNDIITEASLTYQGCPALAACAAATIHHILKSKVVEAKSTTPKEIWEGLESLPFGHDDHVDFSLNAMIETLEIYLDQKHLGQKEHEEYMHICGFTGKEVDDLDPSPCSNCTFVQNCENDHDLKI
jgi:NifU-like protein involved in Fe-S cluster formation